MSRLRPTTSNTGSRTPTVTFGARTPTPPGNAPTIIRASGREALNTGDFGAQRRDSAAYLSSISPSNVFAPAPAPAPSPAPAPTPIEDVQQAPEAEDIVIPPTEDQGDIQDPGTPGADGIGAIEKGSSNTGVSTSVSTGEDDAAISAAESALSDVSVNPVTGQAMGLSSDPRQRQVQEDYLSGKLTKTQASAKLTDIAQRKGATKNQPALTPSAAPVGAVSSTSQLFQNQLAILGEHTPTTLKTDKLIGLFDKLEARQTATEDRRLERAGQERDRDVAQAESFEEEARANQEAINKLADDKLQRESNERVEKIMQHLAANGSFTTDELGNDNAPTIALKAKIRLDEAKNLENARSNIQIRHRNALTGIINDKHRRISGAEDSYADFQDEIYSQRQQRFTSLESSVLGEQIQSQREDRNEAQIIAREGRVQDTGNEDQIRDIAMKVASGGDATPDDIRAIMAAGSIGEAIALSSQFLEPAQGSQVKEVQLYNQAVEGGYKGSFPDFLKELEKNKLLGKFAPRSSGGGSGGGAGGGNGTPGSGSNRTRLPNGELPGTDEERELLSILNLLGGTKMSDKEASRIESFYYNSKAEGASFDDILAGASGFGGLNDDVKGIGGVLRDFIISETDSKLNASIVSLLNRGNKAQAIVNVENKVLKNVQGNFANTVFANSTVRKSRDILDFMDKMPEGAMKHLGAFDGFVFPIIRQAFADKEDVIAAQKLAAKLTNLVAAVRNKFAGTAVTDTEAKFLEGIIPQVGDQPTAIRTKVGQVRENTLLEYNAARAVGLLPSVNEAQLLDINQRVQLYEGLAGPKEEIDTSDLDFSF